MAEAQSPFPTPVESERLRFERLSFDTVDVGDLYEVCSSDPGIEAVTEHMPWDPHAHPQETHEFVADAEEAWEAGERASYVVRPREGEDGAGEIAGLTGLHPKWDQQVVTFGIWLRRRFWGRGYSGERAARMLRVAFEDLDLEVMWVEHAVGNEKSRRAIEKYVEAHGGREDGRLRNAHAMDGEPTDVVRYSVSRAEWREATEREVVEA